MKKVIIAVVLLATILAVGIYFYNPDRNVIDEGYISSREYQVLEDQINDDKTINQKRESIINFAAYRILADTMYHNLTLPAQIDTLAIDSLISPTYKISFSRTRFEQSRFSNYDYYGWSIFVDNDIKSVLLLVERPDVYKDINVILVTMKDSMMIDMESIGEYKKNLEERNVCTIQIGKDQSIKTKVTKRRFYPIKQKNMATYSYTISKEGSIAVNMASNN